MSARPSIEFLAFVADAEQKYSYGVHGKATVRVYGETREVPATSHDDRVEFSGLAVRYPTGSKIWHGSATYWRATGNIGNLSGGLDNRARFKSLSLVGFYEDARDARRSRHNGA